MRCRRVATYGRSRIFRYCRPASFMSSVPRSFGSPIPAATRAATADGGMTAPWGNLVAALSNHSSSLPVNLEIKGMHAFKADLLGAVWREFLALETK